MNKELKNIIDTLHFKLFSSSSFHCNV